MHQAVLTPTQVRQLRSALLRWYDANRRDLPWRRTRDPYRIWVSEIMLQQTRVAAVLEHYRVFLERFPTVTALASAPLPDVLAAWSGLGYYRRARALHEAAKLVVSDHRGELPADLASLRSLNGIGRYTSAAIASIAFGLPVAVVDGNVERVLGRLLGKSMGGEHTWAAAQALLAPARPGDWNQGMMELGATVCLPTTPKCGECPLRKSCKTPGAPSIRKDPPRIKRTLTYGLATRPSSVYLVQRASTESLMAGMWELPELTSTATGDLITRVKHSITVSDFDVQVFRLDPPRKSPQGRWVKLDAVEGVPLTGLTRKILRVTNLLPQRANPKARRTIPGDPLNARTHPR
jgi:A/G-specific adenine glycosylase